MVYISRCKTLCWIIGVSFVYKLGIWKVWMLWAQFKLWAIYIGCRVFDNVVIVCLLFVYCSVCEFCSLGSHTLYFQRCLQRIITQLRDDPYVLEAWGTQTIDWGNWPHVEYPNIKNFLAKNPSVYTGETMKAYKSLDAYNYYMNGWVSSIKVFEVPYSIDTYIVLGQVQHSQRVLLHC